MCIRNMQSGRGTWYRLRICRKENIFCGGQYYMLQYSLLQKNIRKGENMDRVVLNRRGIFVEGIWQISSKGTFLSAVIVYITLLFVFL